MITILLSIVVAVLFWTFFALLNKEQDTKAIRSVLASIVFDLKDLSINLKKLLVLLVKDAFNVDHSSDERTVYDIGDDSKNTVITESNYPLELKALTEQDREASLSPLNPSVKEIIDEQEQNAA